MQHKKHALISVWDKTGALDFARGLAALGYGVISTGSTAAHLRAGGCDVTEVSELTGFPECLDGRVKTLHPKVHAGILAMRANPGHMAHLEQYGIGTIDIVAVNLYPFKETISKPGVTLEEAIENIDIGGPSMLRSAAKNWNDVTVVCDSADYEKVLAELQNGGISRETRFALSCKAFSLTAAYDALIAQYMRRVGGLDKFPEKLTLTFELAQPMRYGENPHQAGAFYRDPIPAPGTLAHFKQLHGKEMSFCNVNDASGAIEALKDFDGGEACAVAVKHSTPCGVGVGDSIHEAYVNAHDADPLSISGGIVALNREVDAETAAEMAKIFLEIIIAPSYTPEALAILTQKKNIRILALDGITVKPPAGALDIKKVSGGLLAQEINTALIDMAALTYPTKLRPTAAQMEQLLYAWRAVKHTKSNAIVLWNGKSTAGVGAGQVNRVGSLAIAIQTAGPRARGSVMASDAYIPFGDTVELAHNAGVAAIIQTGGSIRDQESIDLCDKYGIPMVFTGLRHFRH